VVQLAEKAAEKKPAQTKAEKSEKKRADGLAEAFPGSQPDPGPEPRPTPELSKEQKAEEDDVRELQVKALEDNAVNVPGHNVSEVLGHSPGKGKNAENDVRALTFLNLGGEVIMSVDKAGDIHFNREEFHQLQRVVGTLAGTL
jgi:hypothetical protein